MSLCAEKNQTVPGAKRGRLLIRQSRVKKDTDTVNQSDEMDLEMSYSHRNLSLPHPKIERHASEPAPRMSSPPPTSSTTMHLLTVPQPTPILTKQHSHPLLPSQTSSCDIQFSHHHQHHPHLSLHRQLSYPGSSETTSHGHSQTLVSTSTSSISTVPIANLSSPGVASSLAITPHSSALHSYGGGSTPFKSEASDYTVNFSGDNASASAMTSEKAQDLSPTNYVVVSEPLSLSVEHVPSIRVKSEELRRSISSPQVQTITMINPINLM